MKFGCGNPRLMEWLELIAKEEDKYDLEAIKQALEGESEKFIKDYISDIISETQGEDFHHFIHRSAVYRRPVDKTAFEQFGSTDLLEKGVDLTLFEKEEAVGHEAVYWVTPVIREKEWKKLNKDEQQQMHCLAYDWYDKKISESKAPDYAYLEEAVSHALASDNVGGACKHVIYLGNYLESLLLYREKTRQLQRVADRITDTVVAEAIQEKDGNIPALYNNLGSAWSDLGDPRNAIEYYEKSLAIDLKVFGDQHPNVATYYNNLGGAWRALGDPRKAIEYFERSLEILSAAYGNDHPHTKTVKANLEIAIKEDQK